jgi:predicted DNA-binding transcriptional regulator AlpA
MVDQASMTQFLTVEQFAQCIQVSRATVFTWMQRRILKKGCHYVKIGRVLRFLWSEDGVKQLLESSSVTIEKQTQVITCPISPGRKKSKPINWDY